MSMDAFAETLPHHEYSDLVRQRRTRVAVRAWIFTVQAFFVGMLVLPTTFQLQRGAVLVMLVCIAALFALSRWAVHRDVLLLWFSTMVVGAFGITWGIVNDAPGALSVSTVHFIWPALYLLFIGLAHNLQAIRRMEFALLLGISLATAMGLIVLAAGLLGLGDLVYPILAFQDAGFGAYDGNIEFRILNLTTVMYGFPFVVALLLARRRELNRWQKTWLWLLVVVMIVVALGSGRRMFWLVLLLSPFLTLFFLQFSILKFRAVAMLGAVSRMAVVAVLVVAGIIVALDLQPITVVQNFFSAFLGQEASSGIRFEQADALWRAFESSPWIGNGLGSTVDSIYRKGWAFELWYLSLLKSVGLLGFLVYAVAVGWIVVKGMLLARRNREFAALFLPLVTAMVSFLIMTATNPYLGKFALRWVIFLPVALINAYLTERSSNA
jgi:O-antigen ligase